MRSPAVISKEIENLNKELKESIKRIPLRKDLPHSELSLKVQFLVEDCYLKNKTIKYIDYDKKEAIIGEAIETYYGYKVRDEIMGCDED